ncbi:MAG TPA: hypothetical protein VEU72_05800 [Nitrosopumilaceae archaeon]|nr:hypothetical protein [Nitrosopumilaceae archaeon]
MSSIKSVFGKLQRSLVLKTSVLSLLLIMSLSLSNSFDAYADTPSCSSSIVNIQDSSYRGPVYLDSFWTDQSASSTTSGTPLKKEIGPGEGPSTLAVVMVNRSPVSIIDVTGVLNLPSGYSPTGTSGDPSAQNIFKATLRAGANNPALASYDNTVTNGSTFTLFFDINVSDKVKVGLYPTPLVVNYYDSGSFTLCNSALITVPFMLPGKVVLDAVPITTSIPPNQPSDVSIAIENKGSSDATGVVVSLIGLGQGKTTGSSSGSSALTLQSSTTQLVNLGANTFNIGTIPAYGKSIITTSIYPSSSASGSTQDVQLQLAYGNAYGYKLSSTISTGLVISPDVTTSTLNISPDNKNGSPLLTAGKLENLNFTVTNTGRTILSNLIISLTPPSAAPQQATPSSISVVGDSQWTVPIMNPGDSERFSTQVFASTNVIDTPASFTVAASYISNGVAKTSSLNLGAYVVGDINIQVNGISVSNVGSTQTLTGTLLNQGSTTGLFTRVQLLHPELLESPIQNNTYGRNAQSIDTTQGGNSGGGLGQLFGGSGSEQPSGGGSGQYSGGGSGQHIRGGSLSSAQAILADSTPQYIGDLSSDSPTPFSIPLSGTIMPGIHQVSFKVVYADDLKHVHELTLNGTVNAQQPTSFANARQGSGFNTLFGIRGGMMMFIYLPVTGASAVVATVFIMKKRNSSKNKIQKNNKKDVDIEALLDDSISDKK